MLKRPVNPTTPNEISAAIEAFCTEIDATREPLYVPVRPFEQARINECFWSVRLYASLYDGEIQHGWTIWERPNVFLEAEFHAVWVSPSGELVDVTPKIDNEDTILFLPDSTRVYEGLLVENRRKPLVLNDLTMNWLWIEHNRFLIKQKHFHNGVVDGPAASEEFAQWAMLQKQTGPPKIGRNIKCLCGSGKKFKRCCGRRS